MEDDDDRTEVEGQLTAESIKLISESVGISSLNDEALNLLIDDGTYRLKQLTQVSWIELMARLCWTGLKQLRCKLLQHLNFKTKNCGKIFAHPQTLFISPSQ